MSKVIADADGLGTGLGLFQVLDAVFQQQERVGSATQYELSGRDEVKLTFEGSGFTYDGQGYLKSGSVTGCYFQVGAEAYALVTDLDVGGRKVGEMRDPFDFFPLLGDISFEGSDNTDTFIGWTGDDTLEGRGGSDILLGGKGDDKLFGGEGDDFIGRVRLSEFKDGGRDVFDGGKGFDVAGIVVDIERGLNLTLESSKFQSLGPAGAVKLVSVEGLQGGDGGDRLTGDRRDNALLGDGGDDTLRGGDGADTLSGGQGRNLLQGGNGLDSASYDGGAPVTVSLAKDGFQETGDGVDKLESIEGLIGGFGGDRLTGDGKSNKLQGADGDDTLDGGNGNDSVFGGLGDDVVKGGAGNDLLNGREGADTMNGGTGDDRYVFGTAAEVGFDTIAGGFGIGDVIDLGGLDADPLAAGNQAFSFRGQSTTFSGQAGEVIWFVAGSTIQVQGTFGADTTADFTIFVEKPEGDVLADFNFIL